MARLLDMYRARPYNCGMKNKTSTSMRLTPEALRLLKDLAEKFGVSQAAVMELAIRGMAERELAKEKGGRG